MAKRTAAVLSRAVRAANPSGVNDRDLLLRFADDCDQSAFAAVVQRHSGMVFGVCKRVLHSPADAEDATQAVFLVLAKKAKVTRWQASAANWLHTTARKVARNARLATERRTKREGAAAVPEAVLAVDTMSGRELLAALDEELEQLPPRYREPLVLCYLEGLTRDEVATRLGVAVPALNKQLERGRKKLADALAARGCTLGVLLLAVSATSSAGASPPRLLESILAAVGGSPSPTVAALAQGVVMNGILNRAKLAMVAVIGVAVMGFGAGAMPAPADPPKPPALEKMEKPKAEAKANPKPPEAKERTITGTVVGPDGKPVAGASIRMEKQPDLVGSLVRLVTNKPSIDELATTDADGKFAMTLKPMPASNPDYRDRQLVAFKRGFGPDWIKVSEIGDGPVSLKLAEDVPVKGTVTDLEGKPVAKAEVRIRSIAAGDLDKVWEQWPKSPYLALRAAGKELLWPNLADLPENVTADADGRFEIKGVGRGRLLGLIVEGKGIETVGCRVVTEPTFDPKKVEQPNDKTMPGGGYQPGPVLYGPTFTHSGKPSQPITGTVTDSSTGKPIVGVQVNGHDDGPHWYENGTQGVKTDAAGKFTLHGIAKTGRVRLTVFPTPTSPYFMYSTTVAGKPGLTEITAELKLTRGVLVKGRVVEKGTGKPVAGADVRYTALADNKFYADLMKGKRGEHGMAWNSDADGRFEFVALPGAGIVTAQGETRPETYRIPYTQVRVAKADLPRADLAHLESLGEMFTAADGHYVTLHSLSGYAIIHPKPTDNTGEVIIEFERGKVVGGKVLTPEGKPAAGVTAHNLTACYDQAAKLKDGTFSAIALDAEFPRTLLFVDEAKKLSATVTLKGDEKDLTLKLEAWGKLTGRLLDAEGKPLAGVNVSAYPKNTIRYAAFMSRLRNRKAVTDAEGRFALDVPGGPAAYLVGFSLKNKYVDVGQRPESKGHSVKSGETTDAGEFKAKAE